MHQSQKVSNAYLKRYRWQFSSGVLNSIVTIYWIFFSFLSFFDWFRSQFVPYPPTVSPPPLSFGSILFFFLSRTFCSRNKFNRCFSLSFVTNLFQTKFFIKLYPFSFSKSLEKHISFLVLSTSLCVSHAIEHFSLIVSHVFSPHLFRSLFFCFYFSIYFGLKCFESILRTKIPLAKSKIITEREHDYKILIMIGIRLNVFARVENLKFDVNATYNNDQIIHEPRRDNSLTSSTVDLNNTIGIIFFCSFHSKEKKWLKITIKCVQFRNFN